MSSIYSIFITYYPYSIAIARRNSELNVKDFLRNTKTSIKRVDPLKTDDCYDLDLIDICSQTTIY